MRHLQTGGRVGGVTVQAASGDLHVIALWRLLAAAGAQMQGANSCCEKRADFERITISFAPLDAAQADLILTRLKAERWVTHALLHVLSSEGRSASMTGVDL